MIKSPIPPLESTLNLIESQGVEVNPSSLGLTRRILTSHVRRAAVSSRRRRRRRYAGDGKQNDNGDDKNEDYVEAKLVNSPRFESLKRQLEKCCANRDARMRSDAAAEDGTRCSQRSGKDVLLADIIMQFLLQLKSTRIHRQSKSKSFVPTRPPYYTTANHSNNNNQDNQLSNTNTASATAVVEKNEVYKHQLKFPTEIKTNNNAGSRTKFFRPVVMVKDSQKKMLLRELLYALQCGGLSIHPSSKQTSRETNDCSVDRIRDLAETMKDDVNVDMVYKIAETACLVYRLEQSIKNTTERTSARNCATRAQLIDFYKIVAALEARLAEGKLSLRQLCIYLREPHIKLHLLCSIVGVISENMDTALLLSLPLYANHASPIHKETMSQISDIIIAPVWKMLHNWIFYGKLSSSSSFFIGVNTEADWMHRYFIKYNKLPSFLREEEGLPELLLKAGQGMCTEMHEKI